MAQSSLRLRRALTSLTSFHRSFSPVPTLSPSPLLNASIPSPSSQQLFIPSIFQSRLFRSPPTVSLASNKTYHMYKEGDEITPETILFEGCDYNHWLITMDFPKGPKPSPEEMVRTYEETCAKGLNISLEEAKQRMYACSTTTYQGFQAVMTEEESEKFQGLPGVVFILPDSYIDPQNKEYGGDKYINGTIIPRPPPIQRNTAGKFRDRGRTPDRPRFGQQGGPPNQEGGPMQYQQRGPMPNQQGGQMQYQQGGPLSNQQRHQENPPYNSRGPMQGDGRNYGPPQNHPPQQNFGTPGQGERGGPMPVNNRDYAPGGKEPYQADRRGPMPPFQGSYNQGEQGNYHPPQGDQRGFGQRNLAGDNLNYAPPSQGGIQGQGASSNYGQSYPRHGEGQRFSPGEQGNVQGEKMNYPPMGQTTTNQGRY